MPVPNSLLPVASLHRPFQPELTGGRQENEPVPAFRPSPVEPPETSPGLAFKEVVRANLHAAAQHAILGHKGPSFRECSHPVCRNAGNLIPYPVAVETGVTEADLEEIFQRVVPAALEKAMHGPSTVRTAPEWPDEPAFVS